MRRRVVAETHLGSLASWTQVLEEIEANEAHLRLGGGERAVERQHGKGRLTARERVSALLDPGSPFFELSLFAAFGMYREWGGAPAAGVLTGVGRVGGRLFMLVANDATVKAGAFFPLTVKKVLRAQRIAADNRLPLIYLVDSAGVFLPLQDEIFPDEDDFGRIFRNNARLSADGVVQMAAIMGSCVAGGAYLPVMCDKILMTEGSGLYIAGPSLVKAAIGQDLESEELGGARLHARLSGTIDFCEPDDPACLERLRELAGRVAPPGPAPFSRSESREPAVDPRELYRRMPLDVSAEYDVRQILECILDAGTLEEYKADYGQTLVCAYARLCGWSVGVVASQKRHVRDPDRPYEFGGVIYPESADKAARFILDCNQSRIPLLFFQDVNGFMVGRRAEVAGIIRSGAKMVNAVANSVVPKITVILGGSYGAGNYALCGKGYDPRFIFAWPTCRYAVMGGEQAARTLLELRLRQLKAEGKEIDEAKREELQASVRRRYAQQMDARYAAARLWVDRLIAPHTTREWLAMALEVAALNPDIPPLRTGVLQV